MIAKVSLKHYLFTGRGTSGELPIYLRITLDRKKAEVHSGFASQLKNWNKADQATKNNTTVNKELTDQKARIYDLLVELQKSNSPISAMILKDLFTGKGSTQKMLIEYFNKYIAELEVRDQIKKISLNKYRQSVHSLNEYLRFKYNSSDLAIDKVNYGFINEYDLFLKQKYDLHRNTINKYHSRLRTILLRAQSEGIIQKQPYTNFKLASQKTERTFLSQDDLNKLIDLDLSYNKSLDKVKDIFLFSCYTGLRFQDAQNLTENNLTSVNNKPFLRFTQEKTHKAVDIPLLPIVKEIIRKYCNESERLISKKLLPKISNQKVNSYLKIIGDLAGVNQLITHHMARHTFATTICLNNNMPMEDLSKILGHTNIKTTSIYGRITQQRLSESMAKVDRRLKAIA